MTSSEPKERDKTLQRVLKISRLNGWSVIIFAGAGILLAGAMGDLVSVFIGLLVGAAGWMEVRGHNKLKRRDPEGMRWLVRSQMFLLAVILVYCASRLGSFDQETMLSGLTPDMQAMLKESGVEMAEITPIVRMAFLTTYGLVAAVSLLYQGGMALYYRRRIKIVTEALTAPPDLPARPSHFPPSI